jgi:hypothetical protein
MAETSDASRTTKRLRSDFIFQNAQNVAPLSSCLSPYSLRVKGKKRGGQLGRGEFTAEKLSTSTAPKIKFMPPLTSLSLLELSAYVALCQDLG